MEPINHKLRRGRIILRIRKMRIRISTILCAALRIPTITIALIRCARHDAAASIAPSTLTATPAGIVAKVVAEIRGPRLISI